MERSDIEWLARPRRGDARDVLRDFSVFLGGMLGTAFTVFFLEGIRSLMK